MGIITEKVDQRILMEADTSAATNVEMAICYHYNLQRTAKDNEIEALKISGISDTNFAKLTPEILSVGEKVASQMGNRGSMLIHSGAMKGGSNFYKGGADTTPKADFFGNKINRISLKKSGDTGKGAQLMSAKSAEAAGVFLSSIGHFEKNEGGDLSKSKEFQSALDILQNKMLESFRNDMVVQAGKSKQAFLEWYISQSTRFVELNKKFPEKKVVDHLRAELSILGATTFNKNAYKKLLPGVTKLDRKTDLKKYQDEFEKNADVKIGDIQVSARHLKNVSADKLTSDAIKSQVAHVVENSVNGTQWKIELQKFFDNNQNLKKWVVYEAGSGLFKFTGQYSDGKPYAGSNDSVANRILVFNDSGIAKEHQMMKYAKANPQLCDKIDVTFKASGKSSYLALRIASEVEHELPMLQEELKNLESEFLAEGIIQNMQKKFSNFVEKAKKAIWNFVQKLIKRIIGNIKVLANKGITAFNEAMGLDMQGRIGMKTPSW